MTTFDFFCSTTWYGEHLWPVWQALRPEERGRFFQPFRNFGMGVFESKRGGPDPTRPAGRGDVAVVASNYDQLFYGAPYPAVARFEHGAGFSYHGSGVDHASYAGGSEVTPNVRVLPATNRWVRDANARAFPEIPGPIVGCPKLDAYSLLPKPTGEPVVALSFHWDCHVAPEARSSFFSFRRGVPVLAERLKLIGHGHPRAWAMLKNWYGARGIEPVERFEDVARRASVYVCDSSSTIFEFAALDRPVVLMNAPWYRKDVHHGLRFWEGADVGVQCDNADDLADAVEEALRDAPAQAARRREVIEEVYPLLGRSSPEAAEALRKIVK